MKKSIILFIGFVLITALAQSQNILKENLRWHSDSTVVISRAESLSMSTNIVTFGNSKIELRLETVTHTFAIQKTSGSWLDVSQPGKMTYYTNLKEIIVIERTDNGDITVLFDLTGDDEGVKQLFIINSLSTL